MINEGMDVDLAEILHDLSGIYLERIRESRGGGMKTGTRSWRRGASHDPSPQSEAPTEILFKEKENQPPMNTDKDMIKNES